MKKIIFGLFILVHTISFSQDLIWETDFQMAQSVAKSEGKPILMYFTGSDWCAPCKQLKADFFNSEEFIKKSEGLVLLVVDLPFREDIITPEQRKKNKLLGKKYNPSNSFPTIVGVNSNGTVLNTISAYSALRDTTLHFNFLNNLLNY